MKKLTLLTWNIGGYRPENFRLILDMIKEKNPDVIFLQECHRGIYEELIMFGKLNSYKTFLPDECKKRDQGEIAFSRFPMKEFSYLKFFKSKQGRGIIRLVIDIDRQDFVTVATSQLEKGDYSLSIKKLELGNVDRLRDNEQNPIIFAGDTQFFEFQKNATDAIQDWNDAWNECGANNDYYTLDSDTNFQVASPLRERPDRVYFYSLNRDIICSDFELVGKNVDIQPCLHYGILTTFHIDFE